MKHLALAALLVPTTALAAGTPGEPYSGEGIEFSLDVARQQVTLEYNDGRRAATTIERLGISWYERVAPRVELGLLGGKLYLTQTRNATTAGLEPDGYYAGFALRAVLLDATSLRAFVDGSYTYQRVEEDGATQSLTMSWYQPRAKLGVTLFPAARVHVSGGVYGTAFDGQERVSGTASTDFERSAKAGGFVSIDFAVERSGIIGIDYHSGAERSAGIFFKRAY